MGSYTGATGNTYITLKLITQVVSQDVAANTTTLNWTLHVTKSGASTAATWGSCNYSATINGQSTGGSGSVSVSPGGDVTLLGGTATVPHNSDGTKTISLSAAISGKISGSLSASETLSTIPRCSTLAITGSTMGSAVGLGITAASSGFTHSLTYQFGTASGTILSYKPAGNYTWTPPLSMAQQIPNAASGVGSFVLYTWAGEGVSVGTKAYSFTLSVPTGIVPTITSVTAVEAAAGIGEQFGAYVQAKSKLAIATVAAGIYGSTISKIVVSVLGKAYTGANVTTEELEGSGAVPIAVTVTDSRGRSAATTKTVNVLPYATPAITGFTACRCTSDGTAADDGNFVALTYAYTVAPVGNQNTAAMTVQARRASLTEGSWTTMLTGNAYSADTTTVPIVQVSSDYQWNLRLTLTDFFGSTEMTITLPSAEVIFDLLSTGDGAAFGKTSENAGQLDVDWDVLVRGDLRVDADGDLVGLGCNNDLSNLADGVAPAISVNGSVYPVMKTDQFVYLTAVNLDQIRRGVYWINGYGSIAGTTPFTNAHYMLFAAGTVAHTLQVAIHASGSAHTIKTRYRAASDTWTSWT